jgi:hypothetical protein
MNEEKMKLKNLATDKEKPPGGKRPQCKPLSLFPLTFDEIVETALNTKPKKRVEEDKDSGIEHVEEKA